MTAGSAWRTLASRMVLRTPWFRLRADDCETPSGHRIAPYYVLEYSPWANVVALTAADEIVLVRQYRHAADETMLELPGGVVDAGETPAEAARRELLEEAGYAAETFTPVAALWANPASHTNRLHSFAARNVTRAAAPAREAGEDGMTVVLMPVADLLSRLPDGILPHAMQVSGLLLGLAALGRIRLGTR